MAELKMYGLGAVPKHCFKCGLALAQARYFAQFSEADGLPIYYTVLYCPKWKYLWASHQTYSFDENGREMLPHWW